MSGVLEQKGTITLSPALRANDAWANYWMRQVTLRLRREICWCWYERGLLPDSHPGSLPPFTDKVSEILDMSRFWEEKSMFYRTDPTARYLTEQLEADPPDADERPARGSFVWVVDQLDLDDVSAFIMALGLAVAFDSAVGSVVAACLNDPAKTHPNLALAQKLWDQPDQVLRVADPAHRLFGHGLLQLAGQSPHAYSEIDWDSPIRVPWLVANQLLFPGSPIPHSLSPIAVESDNAPAITGSARLVASRLTSKHADTLRVVPIRGSKSSAYAEIVRGIAKGAKREVVEFNGDPSLLANDHYVDSLATLCWLKDVDLYLDEHMVSVLGNAGDRSSGHVLPARSIPITVLVSITQRSQLAGIPDDLLLPIVDAPDLSYSERVDHWKRALGKGTKRLTPVISECSRRFRYGRETIDAISDGLKALPGPISNETLVEACRAELRLDVGELAQEVVPRFKDERLILPPRQHRQFREFVKAMNSLTEVHYGWGTARVWNESGISALFAGPPGTGKTMGAEILANELDLPMYRIDLSQVVNKYIGETEKNLKRLFDAADISDVILFFDEADSLFGRRTEVKDAHDRYANLEISYLLERMERFKGVAILATNRKRDLDEAFLRRLRFIIDFPPPGIEQRKEIWLQVIPETVDASQVDFDFLARKFDLTGGHINSIVFYACLQSANGSGKENAKRQLAMEDVIVAVKREYDKLNRSVSLEHFGPHAEVVERMEREHEER
jgi:hypothetical protein